MIRYFTLLVCFVFGARAATQLTYVASDYNLPLPWTYSASTDTPQGSWVAPLVSVASISTGPIPLGATLSAGTPVKVFIQWLDYDSAASFTTTLGGTTSSPETLDDRDDNQYWSDGTVLTPAASANNISFTFTRSIPHDGRLITIYITTDTNEVVLRDDRAIAFLLNPTPDPTAAVPGNHVPNSSFELGIGPFWRIITANGAERTNTLSDLWTTAAAFEGTHSALLTTPTVGTFSIESNPLTLASNKVHTATVYARTASGTATANLYVRSLYDAPSGFPSTLTVVDSRVVNALGWTRLSVTYTNLYYPNGQYFLTLLVQKIGSTTDVYFDGLQVEEGNTATAYATTYPYEFDISASEPTQVFHTTDASPLLTLRAYNSSGGLLTRTLAYTIYNATNGVVTSGSTALAAAAGSAATTTIAVPATSLGHHRAIVTLTNQNSDVELTYLMVHTPAVALPTLDTNSYFGTHINASASAAARAQRLGVKWTRSVSLGRMRWSEIEATPGVYTYPDLTVFGTYGISILGNIGEGSPSWAQTAGQVNVIGAYTTNLVSHFNYVPAWEIMNEPEQDASITNSLPYYGQIVQVVAPLVQTYAPGTLVMGGGGVLTADQITNFWAYVTSTNAVNGFTVHEYPPNEVVAPSLKTRILDVYGKPIWNTEAGITDKGSYTFARAPFRYAGHYVISWRSAEVWYDSFNANARAISRDFLTCLAYGQQKMFYYDGGQRNIETFDFVSRQFTYLDYDDSVRVKGGALAGMWRLLDKCTGRGTVSGSASLEAYAYTAAGTNIVAFWAPGTNLLTAALSGGLATSSLRLYDLNGNVATPASTSLAVTPLPQLIVGYNSLSLSALTNAFYTATVSVRADTSAPSLVFASIPRASGSEWRWFALDDNDTPNESNPNAITYRYAFNSEPYSAWTGTTWVERSLTGVTGLTVQARDLAGNISTITYGVSTPASDGGVIVDGRVRLRGMVNLRTL